MCEINHDDYPCVDQVNFLAISLLDHVGVTMPSQAVIDVMESVLSHTVIKKNIVFNQCLDKKECVCLFWAAKGKTTEETAKIMNMSSGSIEASRRNIKRKLQASSLAQAVFEGMRFDFIHPSLCSVE